MFSCPNKRYFSNRISFLLHPFCAVSIRCPWCADGHRPQIRSHLEFSAQTSIPFPNWVARALPKDITYVFLPREYCSTSMDSLLHPTADAIFQMPFSGKLEYYEFRGTGSRTWHLSFGWKERGTVIMVNQRRGLGRRGGGQRNKNRLSSCIWPNGSSASVSCCTRRGSLYWEGKPYVFHVFIFVVLFICRWFSLFAWYDVRTRRVSEHKTGLCLERASCAFPRYLETSIHWGCIRALWYTEGKHGHCLWFA